jgi:2'-5' RNA ligase
MARLRDELASLAATPPLQATVRGLGAFPDLRRPRVLWAGVDCAALAAVAQAVDAAATRLGVVPETRPFHAHVTLGRVKGNARAAPLLRDVAARAAEDFGACTFRELIAFRSDLRPGGALYTKLWSIPFGG